MGILLAVCFLMVSCSEVVVKAQAQQQVSTSYEDFFFEKDNDFSKEVYWKEVSEAEKKLKDTDNIKVSFDGYTLSLFQNPEQNYWRVNLINKQEECILVVDYPIFYESETLHMVGISNGEEERQLKDVSLDTDLHQESLGNVDTNGNVIGVAYDSIQLPMKVIIIVYIG